MSYKLLPPGTRHGNRVYYAVVTLKGKRREVSTETRDRGLARKFAQQLEAEMYQREVLGSGAPKTAASAIDAYIAFRRPTRNDERYLTLLRKWLGKTAIDQITQEDFDRAAQALYPGRTAETWNRQVYTPLQAVLNHAGRTIRIKRPKQKKPRNHAVAKDVAELLITNAGDPDLNALLVTVFYQGCRISEAISLTPERVDLVNRRICFDVSKNDEDSWRPMHEKVFEALASQPDYGDRMFRWKTRWGPRKALSVLRKKLGVRFTFHMGRHSFATWLADEGTHMKDIMEAGGWADHKSVLRYTGSDLERVRKAVDKL